jgi:hypothetical protein
MPEPLNHHDKGNHPSLSEDWLIDNLPEGWSYDCHMGEQWGFVIYPPIQSVDDPEWKPTPLFIPLDLLKHNREWKDRPENAVC